VSDNSLRKSMAAWWGAITFSGRLKKLADEIQKALVLLSRRAHLLYI